MKILVVLKTLAYLASPPVRIKRFMTLNPGFERPRQEQERKVGRIFQLLPGVHLTKRFLRLRRSPA
jgi:hypothetical protein